MASPFRSLCTAGLTLVSFTLIIPVASGAQASAVKCKDGTTTAITGRGACSNHGGVDKSATKTESKTVKAQEKVAKAVVKKTTGTQVTQMCADGTKSNSTGRGACSGHGGVKGAEATSKTTGATVAAPVTMAAPKPKSPVAAATHTVGSGAADDKNPMGAIAQCKDGMYSHAKNHTGACSRHGGVAKWM